MGQRGILVGNVQCSWTRAKDDPQRLKTFGQIDSHHVQVVGEARVLRAIGDGVVADRQDGVARHNLAIKNWGFPIHEETDGDRYSGSCCIAGST